ncbi:hypothetical protein [Litorisediminicola beolgyonensis]
MVRPIETPWPAALYRPGLWIALIVALVAVTQGPTYFDETLDYDEQTFILMAASVLDGHLPYTQLIDNKPPGLFIVLAGAMALLGESWLAVRAFGDLCLVVLLILVFQYSKRFASVPAAGLASSVLALTTADFMWAHTSSEILAMVPLLGAFMLIDRDELTFRRMALAGVLVAAAVLIRTNLAIVAVLLGVWLLFRVVRTGKGLAGVFGYGLGGLSVLALLLAAYASAGALPNLWVAAVEVPLSYSANQSSSSGVAYRFLLKLGFLIFVEKPWLWVPYVALVALGIARSKRAGGRTVHVLFLWAAITFVALSILKSGTLYGHHMTQLLPLLTVASARGLDHVPLRTASAKFLTLPIALGMIASVGLSLISTTNSVRSGKPLVGHGDVANIAAIIQGDIEQGDTIWAIRAHILHHVLNVPPIYPVMVHPENIVRDEIRRPIAEAGFLPDDAFQRVVDSRPQFIIFDSEELTLYPYSSDMPELEGILAQDYEVAYESDAFILLRYVGNRE